MKSIFIIIFIGIFYAVGLSMLIYGLRSARKSSAAGSWPSVRGTLTECKLKSGSDGDGGKTHEVKVEYRYTVAGKEMIGSKLAFGYNSSNGEDAHDQIYSRLRPALHNPKGIDVRYDPSNPTISTLSFGLHRSIQYILAFAVTWLAFCIGFTLIWWVASKNDNVLLKNLVVREAIEREL